MMQVTWTRCQGNVWCNLMNVNLDHPSFAGVMGVFLVWRGSPQPATIYVGHGAVGAGIKSARQDPRIRAHQTIAPMYVTWAAIPPGNIAGVHQFLVDKFNPLVRDIFPHAAPAAAVEVNLPA